MFRNTSILLLLLASPSLSYAQLQYVQPIDWSRYAGMTGVRSQDTYGTAMASIMQNQSRYLYSWVGSQCTTSSDTGGQLMYTPKFSLGDESAIRSLTMFTYGSAVMLQTGIYSAQASEMSQSEAMNRTEMAIRGVALTHVSNKSTGDNWGNAWQSALWTAQVSEAAWMSWSSLSESTRGAVATMLHYEANRFLNYNTPYWAKPNGTINFAGDTKAEENSWNARVLTVAQAMMPNSPNAAQWRTKASELMISAFSRPSDLTNTQIVDGKAVKDWINGYNTFENGLLVNHNIVHPDYLATITQNYETALDCTLARQFVPQSAFFNAVVNYNALTDLQFTAGSSPYGSGNIVSPGGSIYKSSVQDGTVVYDANLYYPQDTDWSKKRFDNHSLVDLWAEYQGLDAGKPFDALGWAKSRTDAILALQNRTGHDGNIYQSGDWTADYYGKEPYAFQAIGEEWLLWWLMQNNQMSPVGDGWAAIPVPEPSSLCCLLTCGLTLTVYLWRSRRKNASCAVG